MGRLEAENFYYEKILLITDYVLPSGMAPFKILFNYSLFQVKTKEKYITASFIYFFSYS